MHTDVPNDLWRVLAERHRREILRMLQQREHTTGELSAAFDISRFAVMKHLTILERAGLIESHKRGRERWNRLRPLQTLPALYSNAVPDSRCGARAICATRVIETPARPARCGANAVARTRPTTSEYVSPSE